ncbi:MAG: putative transcriptional regulator YvhJ [Candidatus Dichloromethanomonas elyunquensis]|nr:MAG: putative transcriptional regulator YvhJ [Candidatus Dichloromethanomonas elyunquensis]
MKKRAGQKRKVFIVIAILFAGIISGTAAFGYVYFNRDEGDSGLTPYFGQNAASLDKRVSFLLIGTDKRPGESAYNSDSIIVASFDPNTKLITMLSVPRDTRVTLSGSNSFVKINAVPMLRGISGLMNQVTDLTGIPLDGYVLTNFNGFKNIIDTLGGITVNVEKDMFYETGDKVDGVINLKAGLQQFNGTQALEYARFRHDAMADIGRTARQQNVLKAVAKEILQPSTIPKLPKLIPQLMDAVETNLKLMDLLKLSTAASSFNSSNIVTQTLPGVGLYLDDISYWEVNRNTAKEVAQNLLMGITTDKVVDNMVVDLLDPVVKAHITVPGNSNDPNGIKSPGHVENPKQTTASPRQNPDIIITVQ